MVQYLFLPNICITDIDDCIDTPCKNGATCKDGINSYSCICPLGLTGKACELSMAKFFDYSEKDFIESKFICFRHRRLST